MSVKKFFLVLSIILLQAAGETSSQSYDGQSLPAEDGGMQSIIDDLIFTSNKIDDNPPMTPKKPSQDSTRIGYALKNDKGYWYYVISGPEEKTIEAAYENIGDVVFSPDGEHHGYKALKGQKWMAVIDGSEGGEYDEIYSIIFSQDGKRYAYRAKDAGQEFVVVDGRQEGPFKAAYDPLVSSNGQHVIYTMVKEGNDHYVVVDGEAQQFMGSSPTISPDGSRWAYSFYGGYSESPCYIVLDGEFIDLEEDKSNRVAQMAFSPGGNRFAYDLVPGGGAYGNHIVVVDGVPGKSYPDPGVGKIVFSPDETTVAYWAKSEDDGYVMVINGVEAESINGASDPVISQDGSRVAWIVEEEGGMFAVLDGMKGKRYQSIWGLTFSPDGRLAYSASESRERGFVHMVVVDGQEDQTYLYNGKGQGIKAGPLFSPEGEHVVYIANDGGEGEYTVVDGVRRLNTWSLLGGLNWGEGSSIVFDSEERLHYLAENETGIYIIIAAISSSASGQSYEIADEELSGFDKLITDEDSSNLPPKVDLMFSPKRPSDEDSITLSAVAVDPDGDSLSYEWFSGNMDSAIKSGSDSEMQLKLDPGDYQYSVMVSDGKGGKASDVVRFSVTTEERE